MKTLLTLIFTIMCVSAFAQERVELNAINVEVPSDSATLVRTTQTPDVVTLTMKVPMASSVCERFDTRMVMITSSIQCGSRPMQRVENIQVCVRRNPGNNQCLRYENQVRSTLVYVANTCSIPESFCAQYGTQTTYESDEVVIKFKGLPDLSATEQDTFSIKARQRSYNGENVVYDVTVLSSTVPLEVKNRGLFGLDKFVIVRK